MSETRTAVGPVDDRVLVTSADLPVPAAAAFALFASAEALSTWLCEDAVVEPQAGGRYELFWNPGDRENDSTIGCRLTAFEPGRLLAFQWRSPRQFKPFANAADPLTHVVVTVHAHGAGSRLTLVHSGWRASPDWQQAADWQAAAWDHAFQALAAAAARIAATAPADRFDHAFIEPSSFDDAVAFYRDGLGWTATFQWGGPGEPRGMGLDGGGTRLVLAERHPAADHSKSHGIAGHRPTLHLSVPDLDARHRALQARGLPLFDPERTHWGTRWFVVRDPDGNLIAFEEAAP